MVNVDNLKLYLAVKRREERSRFTSILVKQYASNLDARGEDYAGRVSEAAHRMDELLQDLLEYGRVCHSELLVASVDLDALCASVTKRFSGEIESKGAQIECRCPMSAVWADRQMLETVLANLFSNALKFAPPGTAPHIHVWAKREDTTVRFWVEDRGIGIPAQFHERIFGIFERLDVDRPATPASLPGRENTDIAYTGRCSSVPVVSSDLAHPGFSSVCSHLRYCESRRKNLCAPVCGMVTDTRSPFVTAGCTTTDQPCSAVKFVRKRRRDASEGLKPNPSVPRAGGGTGLVPLRRYCAQCE